MWSLFQYQQRSSSEIVKHLYLLSLFKSINTIHVITSTPFLSCIEIGPCPNPLRRVSFTMYSTLLTFSMYSKRLPLSVYCRQYVRTRFRIFILYRSSQIITTTYFTLRLSPLLLSIYSYSSKFRNTVQDILNLK